MQDPPQPGSAMPGAVIAFNVFNAETILGVAAAVSESGLPAWLQTSASTVRCYGAAALAGMVRALAGPGIRGRIMLHLDHCDSDDLFRECLEAGWDSIMIDASGRPLSDNIRRTREVVELAREYNAMTEGEIGVVGGEEDGFAAYAGGAARPAVEDVVRFIDETGADLVAVGAGTKHGHYTAAGCQVDQPLLEAVHSARPQAPLVLHGGSGIPDEQVRAAVQRGGIRKVNISTDIKDAWIDAQHAWLASKNPHSVIAGVTLAVEKIKLTALSRIQMLASFQT